MKLTKKIRLIFSLTSMLVCLCMSFVTVGADVMDYSDFEATETETTEDDTILYADGKVSLSDLKSTMDTYAQQFSSLTTISYDELVYLDEIYGYQTDFYGNFADVAGEEGCGSYVGYDNFEVVTTEDVNVLKLTADVHFSEKDIKMTLNVKAFENLGPAVTSTELSLAEAEAALSDKMLEAAANTLMGMGTVFVVLILISLIISCFAFIPKIQAKFAKKEKNDNKDSVSNVTVADEVDEKAEPDDTELIAVIAAAIAASENTTTDSFVVRSIRKRRFS